MSRIVILGAGTAGTIMANRLRRLYAREVDAGETTITVIEQETRHVYQPGLLFVPFNDASPRELVRPVATTLHPQVQWRVERIDSVEIEQDVVHLEHGDQVPYDVLIVASGARLAPEETEGLTGAGWRSSIFDFYTMDGALALRNALARFTGGRLVVNVVEMPIKCPVAPLEFAFLADAYFTARGIRDRVRITYATPLEGAFTRTVAANELSHLLAEKDIELVTEYSTGRVDGEGGILWSWDERDVPFDLLVTIPLHMGAEYVSRSGDLGDDMGFVRTNPNTLQSLASPKVFALGDATNLPASKAGSVAHFQSEVLTENVRRHIAGEPLLPDFDGHANCFIETGFGKALLIDFNYETEPLPGRFPIDAIGPMQLLSESRINHWGKLAFQWMYWHMLLPGHDIPLVGARMKPRVGKPRPPREGRNDPVAPPSPSTMRAAQGQPAGVDR